MMTKLLALLLVAATFSSTQSYDFEFREGCGCCWPMPDSCCKEPTTTTLIPTDPPTTEPPPPTTPPPCECLADVVFVVDRTGSVGGLELTSLKEYINRVLNELINRGLEGCIKHALLSFSKNTNIEYAMGTEDLTSAQAIVNAINRPKGDTFTHLAFGNATEELLADPTPGAYQVIVLFTDGGSEDKDALVAAVQAAAAATQAKLCIAKMDDPESTDTQIFNRENEFDQIRSTWDANSAGGSSLVLTHDFKGSNAPEQMVTDMVDCICDSETTGIPPAPPTTAPPPPTTPPPCDCETDVAFLFDRTGSVSGAEVRAAQATALEVASMLDLVNCARTAAFTFSRIATELYDFGDAPDTASIDAFFANTKFPTQGNTNTHLALEAIRDAFLNRSPPLTDEACKVLVMFTDAGSEDKTATIDAAQSLRDTTGTRVCLVEMDDPDATNTENVNRANEITNILANSAAVSMPIKGTDFRNLNALDQTALAQEIKDCVCALCFNWQI